MEENGHGQAKEDLRATALNDIKKSVEKVFTTADKDAWGNMVSSLQTAFLLGVSDESVLSTMLNAIPKEIRHSVVLQYAMKNNLTGKDIEAMLAPED